MENCLCHPVYQYQYLIYIYIYILYSKDAPLACICCLRAFAPPLVVVEWNLVKYSLFAICWGVVVFNVVKVLKALKLAPPPVAVVSPLDLNSLPPPTCCLGYLPPGDVPSIVL